MKNVTLHHKILKYDYQISLIFTKYINKYNLMKSDKNIFYINLLHLKEVGKRFYDSTFQNFL